MPGEILKGLVRQVIKELTTLGLKVVAMTADQGSNFVALLNLLGVTVERPVFQDLDGNDVVVFHDPPHLLKSIRNCLSKNNIQTSTGTARWKHLEEVYKKDKTQKTRMLHKLRDRHFKLHEFGNKMNVRRAAQVLSHSMAAALSTHASLGSLPKEAQESAEFVKRVNNMFDLCNSSKTAGKKYKGLHCKNCFFLGGGVVKCKSLLIFLRIFTVAVQWVLLNWGSVFTVHQRQKEKKHWAEKKLLL